MRHNAQKFTETHKLCVRCSSMKTHAEFSRHRASSSGLASWCKECLYEWKRQKYIAHRARFNAVSKEARRRLKQQMVDAYGGSCTCCGESDLEFLTVEHVNRDGKQHRMSFRSAQSVWADLRRRGWPKGDYTVLCMNCNWASRFNGVCPHSLKPIAYGWCV